MEVKLCLISVYRVLQNNFMNVPDLTLGEGHHYYICIVANVMHMLLLQDICERPWFATKRRSALLHMYPGQCHVSVVITG